MVGWVPIKQVILKLLSRSSPLNPKPSPAIPHQKIGPEPSLLYLPTRIQSLRPIFQRALYSVACGFLSVLNNNLIDEYIKLPDPESFQMARRLVKEEGLLIGGSSGGAVWAATQVASRLNKGDKCLVILPDSIRNYLTKFADDEWMLKQGFIE